jgi:hypothetical protein
MGGYARGAQERQELALQAQLGTLRTVIGSEARPMNFGQFIVCHEVFGWRSYQDPRYRIAHDGAVPTGPNALATRLAFASEWYTSVASLEERAIVDKDYQEYRVRTSDPHFPTHRY